MNADLVQIHALRFPRDRFTSAEAMAWGSLHGFDHASVRRTRGHILMPQDGAAPRAARRASVIDVDRRDGITAVAASLAPRRDPDERYERHSAKLRAIALSGRSTIHRAARTHTGNDDLAAWYVAWFPTTHRGASRRELRIAREIVHGLRQASRAHALTYVRKLGHRGSRSRS